MIQQKPILIISPEPWSHLFVSKHHYSVELGKRGNKVYFLNPPSNGEIAIKKTKYENVSVVDYPGHFKGLRFLPSFLQKLFIRRSFQQIEKALSVNFDVVWSFDNSVFFNFNALPQRLLTISHIVDLNQDFQTAKAATTADICFCTTDLIMQRLKGYNPNTYKIHHGYHALSSASVEFVFPGKNKIKACYIGNLSMAYLDWKPLLDAAKNSQSIDFVFVGSEKESETLINDKEELKKLNNTYFVGRVEPSAIQNILSQADVLLVSYQEAHHRDQASPHKFMEYFNSGKVIVATYTDEYRDKRHLLEMSDKNEEYPALFSKVLGNLDYYNSEQKQYERKEFARNNTYLKQIERIEKHISDSLNK